MFSFLLQKKNLLSYLSAFLIGLYFLYIKVPFPAWYGQVSEAVFHLVGDNLQHLIGSLYFMKEPFHWSLFSAENLEYPFHPTIGKTDSIPLFSLVLKIIAHCTGSQIQTISPYYALSVVLQPVAAVFALRSMGAKDLKSGLAVALLASMLPTWWLRGGHVALFGQWVILVALGVYFRTMRNASLKWGVFLNLWAALSFLIHPYICIMLLAIVAAVPISAFAQKNIPFALKSVLGLIGACLLIVIFAVTCGYTNNVGGGGFESYSMDLLAPLWPEKSSFFSIKSVNPSIEGFQYLGIGLLILSCVAIWIAVQERKLQNILYHHAGILFACCGLLFIATGHLHIAGIQPFGKFSFGIPFAQDLRSCGRFFWPVSYLIILCTLYLLRNLKWQVWLPLIGACLSLQMLESRHLWGDGDTLVYRTSATAAEKDYIALVQQHDFVQIYPRLECSMDNFEDTMRAIYAASLKDIPVNSMYLARTPKAAACAASGNEDFVPTEHPNTLYLFKGKDRKKSIEILKIHFPDIGCQEVTETISFCSQKIGKSKS